MTERVRPGEKGVQRLRRDKRVRRYLQSKRPAPDDLERVTTYRTEACLGANMACEDGADADVLAELVGEYRWALSTLRAAGRPVPEDFDDGYR